MKHCFQKILLNLFLISLATAGRAQANDRDCIRMGNNQFRKGNYPKAETFYLKAKEKRESIEAFYNLGNALVAQGKDSTAYENYVTATAQSTPNALKRASAYHNMGNLTYSNGLREMMTGGENATQSFQQAVENYKSALRLNPNDNETRYNLAMAQHMLKQSQQGGGGNNQNQQQDQDKQQDQKQEQDKQQQEQPKPQPKNEPNQMDDKTAEQLLNSAQQDERDVQRKVQQNPESRRTLEKDW